MLIYEGSAEAVPYAAALVARRPKFAHYNYWRGIASWYAGDTRTARRFIEQAYALDPADPIAQGVLAFALAADARSDDMALPSDLVRAGELLASAEPGAAADGTFTYWIAKVHAQLGDAESAIAWLERAQALGFWDAAWMRKDRALETLHDRGDFEALVDRIAEQRAAFVAYVEREAPPVLRTLLDAVEG